MNNIKEKVTTDLYFAAFLKCIGATLLETRGSYPHVEYVFKEGGWFYRIRRKLKIANWYQLRQTRMELKKMGFEGTSLKHKTMKELLEKWQQYKEID
jgi:hypothetical protein